MTAPVVYIGYDEREPESFCVCRDSLLRRSSRDLHIVGLDQQMLKRAGWYMRKWHVQGADRVDDLDGKPFSTDFAFSRFLVPALNLYQGWALYCDCDFLFTADVSLLFDEADSRFAVSVVKHNHDPNETTKMWGMTQTRYHRKNWSSLVLWNCAHLAHAALTPWHVNNFPGSWLHAFSWLEDGQIGELPLEWNWLSGISAPLPDHETPAAIHFTLGVPDLPGHEDSPYADLWRAERASRRYHGAPLPTERIRAVESFESVA